MPSDQSSREVRNRELARFAEARPSPDTFPVIRLLWRALDGRDVREEWISLTALRAELAATPADHPDRLWREWELALAERQAEYFPTRLFYRVVGW